MGINVGIIGCGLIGNKRAKALGDARLVACADVNKQKADNLARTIGGVESFGEWQRVIERKDVDMVIVATPHNMLSSITSTALQHGKHVLVEKPAARTVNEVDKLIELSRRCNKLVRVGFNHRYHRAVQKAKEIYDTGTIGDLMYIRARYGHGGRIGYDREWRAQPDVSGGGELIDQGMHLIDLSRWFLGDFVEIDGFANTYYWDMPVEDNAFLLLKTRNKQVAFLSASCTEWKNLFSFEIFGIKGKLEINGLGGSYGTESLTLYKMLPEMGPPETTRWEFPMADNSWEKELIEFIEDIKLTRQPSANLNDAKAALQIVEQIYKNSGYDYNT